MSKKTCVWGAAPTHARAPAAPTDVCTLDPPLTPEAAMGRLLTAMWHYYNTHVQWEVWN
jgi:hypothetical protein